MLLLALVCVEPEHIAADYVLSYERLPARYAALGEPDQNPVLEGFLADLGTTPRDVLIDTFGQLDVEAVLRKGGLADARMLALRERICDERDDHGQVGADHRGDASDTAG
jgi:protein-tyrosine phosphatase